MVMEEKLIYRRLADINKEIGVVEKNRRNEAQRFMFRGIDDVMNNLHPLFAKHEVVIFTEVLDHKTESVQTSRGTHMRYTIVKVKYTFMTTDGSYHDTIAYGEAADMGDKGTPKALSIALKYALLQLFLIPTEEAKDVEEDDVEIIDEEQLARAVAEMNAATSTAEARAIFAKYPQFKKNKEFFETTAKVGKYWKEKEEQHEA